MAWTLEQQQAIDLEGGNIIVSAGAGSGKTAVLTARVLRKLQSGVHISELLILTFTNAATQEMKERIRSSIRAKKELSEELKLLDSAYITTFDAFSLAIVQKYHTRLNITHQIKVADEVMIELQKKKILDEIFEEEYLTSLKDFSTLIAHFCLKDDKELKEYLLHIYQKIELKYDKTSYLENYEKEEMTSLKVDDFIFQYVSLLKEKQQTLASLLDSLEEYFDGDFVSKVEDNFKKLLEAHSYEDFVKGCDFKSITVPRNSDEEGKKMKQEIFDVAKEIKNLCLYDSVDEIKEEIYSTWNDVRVILRLLQKLDKRLEEYKFSEEIFSFSDISRLAIRVVKENSDIQQELTNQFQEILVDEYQDTSDTQEMFLSLISKNNLYMVGDIKQSIYRFRNANPYIFKQKYDAYRDTDQGIKIDLLKNFRSRKEVLENINLLFDFLMDDEIGGANYQESHRMVFGNESYLQEGKTNQNYQMDVLTYDSSLLKFLSSAEEEAFLIGQDIKEKIREHYQVFDKDKKMLRDIEYKDFVILLDKSKDFDLYKKIFESLEIPLTIVKEESLTKEEDIFVIKNLLKLLLCIQNKQFDNDFRYAFLSVSRSFLYPTTDEELYEIFVQNRFLETSLYQKCLSLIEEMDHKSLSRYLLFVLDDFSYEEKLITIGNVSYFRTRLEYIYRLCGEYEEKGKTMEEFVEYLDEVLTDGYDLKFNISKKENNSCRIMTIHKSKGLEFPICYFASFSSKFNQSELKERILFDSSYGIILPKVENYYKDTILKVLLKNDSSKEEISERIRLFYVALTRAKEKMIFVLPKQEEEREVRGVLPVYQRKKYSSFLAIMKSLYSLLLPYLKDCEIIGDKSYLFLSKKLPELSSAKKELVIEEVSLPYKVIEKKHYSKERLTLPTKEEKALLDFGTKVHEILEEIDFSSYDLSLYDIDDFMKKKIENFLHSDFMRDKLSMNMIKEYEFVYQMEDTFLHGMIDLLLEDDEKIILVDYKLKNIDDESYDKQLNGYREFIQKKTGKKVFCYLYSIMDETYREV